jgi:type III secretory pathway component EscV
VSTLVGIPLFAGVASFPILILTLTCLNYNILTNVHSQTKAIDWKTAINDFLLSLNTFTILLGVACSVIILGPTLGFPLPVAFVLATIIGLSYGLYQYSNQKCVMNADDDLKLKSYVEYTNSLEIRNPITNQTDSNSLFHSQNYENSLSQVERMQEQPQDENIRSSRVQ